MTKAWKSAAPEARARPGRGRRRALPPPASRSDTRTSVKDLGPLEERVLDLLWRSSGPQAVRDVQEGLQGDLAYTTVMTTLDRLYKKDLLVRRKDGTAYLYAPRYGREELEAVLAREAIDDLLHGHAPGREPAHVLSGFVEAVGRRDARMLDELERLVRSHRAIKR